MPRTVIRPYTKSWAFNGTSSRGVSASAIDLSAGKQFVFDFFWQRTPGISATEMIFEIGTAAGVGNIECYLTSVGVMHVYWQDAGGAQDWSSNISTLIPFGSWQHVTAVIDSTSGAKVCKLLFNSVLTGALATNTATGGSNFSASLTLNVGARNGVSTWWHGNMKDLRITSFTGTWNDADAVNFYRNIASFTGASGAVYTPIHQWLGEDSNATPATAANSIGATALAMTSTTYSTDVPTKARLATRPLTGSLLFKTGTNDRVTMGDNFGYERTVPVSYSGWAYGGVSGDVIISKCDATAKGLLIENFGGGLYFELRNTSPTSTLVMRSTMSTPTVGWYHWCITYDGSSTPAGVAMYINGVSSPLTTVTNTLSSTIINTGNFEISGFNSGSAPFVGYQTDVRIHNTVLTQAEVIDLYVNNIPTHVAAGWDFTDAAGATLTAQTGGVNGTIAGATWSTQCPIKARTAVS